jgi:hypothetical protein
MPSDVPRHPGHVIQQPTHIHNVLTKRLHGGRHTFRSSGCAPGGMLYCLKRVSPVSGQGCCATSVCTSCSVRSEANMPFTCTPSMVCVVTRSENLAAASACIHKKCHARQLTVAVCMPASWDALCLRKSVHCEVMWVASSHDLRLYTYLLCSPSLAHGGTQAQHHA